ncbi:MAG: proton-conducting transporter membrane subunit, partial [Patescibacteria group bacterium]
MSSVGLTLALAGTVLLYFSGLNAGGEEASTLLWTHLHSLGSELNPELVKIAFVFLLIGYGTKIGLVPMHTWLPDAHGKAPTPISALLSAVLLNVALFALIRVKMISDLSVGTEFTGTLLYILGFLSVGIAALSLLRQNNYKRLFAYSSIENMGLIVIGLALATPLGVFAALFQVINHSIAKSFSFFAAGNVLLKYQSTKIPNISNLMKVMPMTGLALMLAAVAMTGFPPFSIFLSKFSLLWGLSDAPGWMLWLLLGLLVIVFVGFLYNLMRLVFNHKPVSDTTDDNGHVHTPEGVRISAWNSAAMILNGTLMLGLGLMLPLGLTVYLAKLTELVLNY